VEFCVVKSWLKKSFSVGREFTKSNACSDKLDAVQYSIDSGDSITDSITNLWVLVNKLILGVIK
jgi:hypothetical protein